MPLNRKRLFQIFLYVGLISLLFLIATQVLGQGAPLENAYPTIPGTQKPQTIDIAFPAYLKYLYNLSIIIAGLLSFTVLAWGGIRYLFSVGKPGRMADAKEQITAAFLGLILIFASFLIVNTINPELTQLRLLLPISHFSAPSPPPPDNMAIGEVAMDEIPIGSLITSEFAASSFLTSTSTDISYPSSTWPATSTGTSTRYSTDFQGALYGARLKRIHEVASTTLPVVDYIVSVLFQEFMDTTDDMMKQVDSLYQKAMSCSCSNCDCGSCYTDDNGNCICNCHCASDTCPDRKGMEKLAKSIPLFYDENKNPSPPLPCKMAEIEYLSKALEAFEESSHLVKNEKYKDQSFYWQSDIEDLRSTIKECVDAGRIDQDQSDKIEELIDLMAGVENKGTYSPETDGPERDIGENTEEVESILKAMKRVKALINPFEAPFKDTLLGGLFNSHQSYENYKKNQEYLNLLTFVGEKSLETSGNFKATIENFRVIFSSGSKKVEVKDDPATFYSVGTIPPPFGSGGNDMPLKEDKNSVFADIPNPDPITFDLNEPPATRGVCDHIAEIPIGKTLDQAIKLTQDILRELKNIYKQVRTIIDDTNKITKEDGLAQKMFDAEDSFIKFVRSIPKCPGGCISEQIGCSCVCNPSDAMTEAKKNVSRQYSEIQKLDGKIKNLFAQTKQAKKSIYESFYKLNSKYPDVYPDKGKMVPHPKANESEEEKRVPIGKDYFCPDKLGNCRDDNGKLDTSRIEERKYTLKEKLAEVQKLLNRSREVDAPKGEKSVYTILLEQLIKLKFAKKSELNYIKSEDKYDLQNCAMIGTTIKESRQKEPYKELTNCQEAKLTDMIDIKDKEACSPDPYLDIDFFNATSSRARRPLVCYCFDEGTDKSYYDSIRFPELYNNFSFLGVGNDYYCCVANYAK